MKVVCIICNESFRINKNVLKQIWGDKINVDHIGKEIRILCEKCSPDMKEIEE